MTTLNIEKPVLSPDFTIEDIHKIREYNYEMTKDYTTEELIAYYKNKADEIAKSILWINNMNKFIGKNLISSLENFKSEFLLIVERERERESISFKW